jgi:hypothetical protein
MVTTRKSAHTAANPRDRKALDPRAPFGPPRRVGRGRALGLGNAEAGRQVRGQRDETEHHPDRAPALRTGGCQVAATGDRQHDERRHRDRQHRRDHPEADPPRRERGASVVVARQLRGERHRRYLDHGVRDAEDDERDDRVRERRGGTEGGRPPDRRERDRERQRPPAHEREPAEAVAPAVREHPHHRIGHRVHEPADDEDEPGPDGRDAGDVDEDVEQPRVDGDERQRGPQVRRAVRDAHAHGRLERRPARWRHAPLRASSRA